MASMQSLAQAMARRRKPPPGYQHFQNEKRGGSGRQTPPPVYHDGAPSPAGTGPFKYKQRRARQSGSPDRYYFNRPHRPRVN